MKPLPLILLFLVFSVPAFSQDSITVKSGESSLALCQQLIQGHWINTKDTSIHLFVTKDSLFVTKRAHYSNEKYSYDAGYQKSGEAPPAGNPDLRSWQGYYIQAWDDSREIESFWTFALYSVSNKYLRIEEHGEDIYKRTK